MERFRTHALLLRKVPHFHGVKSREPKYSKEKIRSLRDLGEKWTEIQKNKDGRHFFDLFKVHF